MELDVNVVVKIYQEELNRLTQEVIFLKAQIKQMQQENKQE